jgi:TrmH family RNA methyltransferase
MNNVSVIAQEFKWPINCGYLARTAANFGFEGIAFINPQCDCKGDEALKFAKHASSLLKKAAVIKSFGELFKKFDYVVATTAMLGTDYNISRSPVTPEQLAGIIKDAGKKKIAIVIGREGEGMSNEEIAKCDFVVTIPSSAKYPTLNVSHAAAIILYELSKHSDIKKIGSNIAIAGKKEKEVIMKLLDNALEKMEFSTVEKKETQRAIWKRMLGKSFLTRREANGLCGFFKKIIEKNIKS